MQNKWRAISSTKEASSYFSEGFEVTAAFLGALPFVLPKLLASSETKSPAASGRGAVGAELSPDGLAC